MTENLRVAMIGYGFMGAAHSQGWRVAPRFFDLPAQPSMTVVVGRDADAVAAAAEKWGWDEAATDWREVIARDDIDIVDIVTPGDTHAEIAIAALEAGKHVLCEKPLANTVAEAEAMTDAAARAAERGVRSMVGFTYRRVPAATFARDLVAAGRIGDDPPGARRRTCRTGSWTPRRPLTWRMKKERAGSGALGDIGAHAVDLTEYITGLQLDERLGHDRDDRPGAPAARRRASASRAPPRPSAARSRSTTSPCSPAALEPSGGRALGTFEATRFAHRTQERPAHRGLGLDRRDRLRPRTPQRARVLRRDAARDRTGIPQDPGDRARPPLPGAVVAGRSHARLRARLLAPGRRLRRRRSPRARSRGPRSPTGCTCSGCSMPSSAAPPPAAPGRRPATDPSPPRPTHGRTLQ